LPTVAETGVKGYEASSWFGFFAPAGTPPDILAKLAAETQRILQLPDMKDRLLSLGAQPAANTPDEFAVFVRDEIAKWGAVIRNAGVRIE
jgi:tripartite-type tricarboxylate transporter receptor subunit TctC